MSKIEIPLLSVIVPIYNEEQCLPIFYNKLSAVLNNLHITYEILFVDDGSTDRSLDLLEGIREKDPAIGTIVLRRNFGHQTALTAGLDFVRGQAVVMLDGDLQHPPELIPELLDAWRAGAKVVQAVRRRADDSRFLKALTSRVFYWILNLLSNTPVHNGAADFRLLDRDVVDALKSFKERRRFLRGMIGWLDFREAKVEFDAMKRAAGESKYTWGRMLRLAGDGIISSSIRPLRAALWFGLSALMISLLYGCYTLFIYFVYHTPIRGWTSMILLAVFLSGTQLILLGVVGEYVGRIYEELLGRPLYLIQEIRSPHSDKSSAS